MKESQDLGLYLGLPISHKRPNRSQVQFIVDKVRARLAKWKTSYLSRAGRLCLIIHSTDSIVPAYYMQATELPAQTRKDLNQFCNNFLWGEEDQKKTSFDKPGDHLSPRRPRGARYQGVG